MTEEVSREDVTAQIVSDRVLEVDCPGCGETYALWFNGGELSSWEHCGYRIALRHARIDLVTERIA